jgi:hypothetical protein
MLITLSLTQLKSVLATFHDAIKGVGPQIHKLPQHNTPYVQWDDAITISQLPQPGKRLIFLPLSCA